MIAYIEHLKRRAEDSYMQDCQLFALGATKQKPKFPEILKHGR